ncbi:MAG: hypothetical protein U5Q03_14970 [Bacteroidota bacterium]|nr:hypothetical protein [Bacteroidota bacterium]
MRVGFLGLGRLGLPIAAVLSQHHRVTGYDPAPSTASRLKTGHEWEAGLSELLNNRIALTQSADGATWDADVIVVSVQTPHGDGLDGATDTSRREPFDLAWLSGALATISSDAPVVVMSTVLPGTCRSLAPLVPGPLIYSPAFPAMGTTVSDILDPEFVLIGVDKEGDSGAVVEKLWSPFVHAPFITDTWETIELAKMAYNTAIGAKTAVANTVGWLADEVNADGERVMDILSQATNRITGPAYLSPGLGDGGACHPRDQLALSWLAREHGVYDLFSSLIEHRSAHSKWVAEKAEDTAQGLPIVRLGAAYKAGVSLTDGSPSLLLSNQTGWPVTEALPSEPHCIIIGAPHPHYASWDFSGHRVVDPWG